MDSLKDTGNETLAARYHTEAKLFLSRHAEKIGDELLYSLRIADQGLMPKRQPRINRETWLRLTGIGILTASTSSGLVLLMAPLSWGWWPMIPSAFLLFGGMAASKILFDASSKSDAHQKRIPDPQAFVLRRLATTCLSIGRKQVYLLEENDHLFTLERDEIRGVTIADHGDGTARLAIQAFKGSPAGSLDSIVLDPVLLKDADQVRELLDQPSSAKPSGRPRKSKADQYTRWKQPLGMPVARKLTA